MHCSRLCDQPLGHQLFGLLERCLFAGRFKREPALVRVRSLAPPASIEQPLRRRLGANSGVAWELRRKRGIQAVRRFKLLRPSGDARLLPPRITIARLVAEVSIEGREAFKMV